MGNKISCMKQILDSKWRKTFTAFSTIWLHHESDIKPIFISRLHYILNSARSFWSWIQSRFTNRLGLSSASGESGKAEWKVQWKTYFKIFQGHQQPLHEAEGRDLHAEAIRAVSFPGIAVHTSRSRHMKNPVKIILQKLGYYGGQTSADEVAIFIRIQGTCNLDFKRSHIHCTNGLRNHMKRDAENGHMWQIIRRSSQATLVFP